MPVTHKYFGPEKSYMPELATTPVGDLRLDVGRAFDRVEEDTNTLVGDAHTHDNKTTLDAVEEALTTALKSDYDGAVTDSHTHANKATLDDVEEAFTTALKSTYDGYATGKEDAGTAATAVGTHESTYDHADFLSKNAISGSFTTVDGKTITVTDGQVTAITGP